MSKIIEQAQTGPLLTRKGVYFLIYVPVKRGIFSHLNSQKGIFVPMNKHEYITEVTSPEKMTRQCPLKTGLPYICKTISEFSKKGSFLYT